MQGLRYCVAHTLTGRYNDKENQHVKYRSKWELCFNAYIKDCTRIAILKESLKFIGSGFKLAIFSSVFSFFVFLGLALEAAFTNDRVMYFVYLPIFLVCEILSLLGLFKAQSKYIEEEYSEYELSQSPPEDYKDQRGRYLKFRRSLTLNDINQSHVLDVLEILECRISLCENSGVSVRRVAGFALTFAMSVLVATMKTLTVQSIAQIGVIGVFVIMFVYILMRLSPNKSEQLYELKYFLTMYALSICAT